MTTLISSRGAVTAAGTSAAFSGSGSGSTVSAGFSLGLLLGLLRTLACGHRERAVAGVAVLGCGELGAEVVVLRDHAVQLGLDLVQELVDLTHVVALAEPDGRKALVAHVLGRQRHDLT